MPSRKNNFIFYHRLPETLVPTVNNALISKTRPNLSRHSTLRQPDAPNFHPPQKRLLALRGAQGDHPTKEREAPEAIAAQPSRNGGIWKALEGYPVGVERYEKSAGSSGGSAEGASEGRQPLTGPLAARRAGGPNSRNKKASVPAGHYSLLSKTRPKLRRQASPKLSPP